MGEPEEEMVFQYVNKKPRPWTAWPQVETIKIRENLIWIDMFVVKQGVVNVETPGCYLLEWCQYFQKQQVPSLKLTRKNAWK